MGTRRRLGDGQDYPIAREQLTLPMQIWTWTLDGCDLVFGQIATAIGRTVAERVGLSLSSFVMTPTINDTRMD